MYLGSDVTVAWPDCSLQDTGGYRIYIEIAFPIFFYVPEVLVIMFSLFIIKQLIANSRFVIYTYQIKLLISLCVTLSLYFQAISSLKFIQ